MLQISTHGARPQVRPVGPARRRGLFLSAAAVAALLVSGFFVTTAAAPAFAADAPEGLSVSVTNTSDEVGPQSTLKYQTVLENSGSAPVDLRVMLTVPSFAAITDAAGAEVNVQTASWPVTVEPGKPVSLDATVSVGDIPAEILWVDANVEAFAVDGVTALVGSADVDPVVGSEEARARAAGGSSQLLLIALMIGGAVVAAALFTGALVLRRRSRRAAL